MSLCKEICHTKPNAQFNLWGPYQGGRREPRPQSWPLKSYTCQSTPSIIHIIINLYFKKSTLTNERIYCNTQILETTGRITEATLEDIGSGRGFLNNILKACEVETKTNSGKGSFQQSGDSIQNVREPMPAIRLIGQIYRICVEPKKKVLKKQQPN